MSKDSIADIELINQDLSNENTLVNKEEKQVNKRLRKNTAEELDNARVDLSNFTSPVDKNCKFTTKVGDGFIKVKVKSMNEVANLCMNSNGIVFNCLLENMRYGNLAYVSPTSISKDTQISLSSVCKSLKKLRDNGFIAEFKAKNGGKYYLISPHICVKGDGQHESMAKAMWSKYIKQKTKKVIKQSSNVIQLTRKHSSAI